VSKSNVIKFTSWSPSRLDDYTSCPFMAKHKHLLKTCPMCFEGKIMGFENPTCDTCGKPVPKGPALVRGSEIGKNLELYVTGQTAKLHKEIRHPQVKEIAKTLRAGFKKGVVSIELPIVMDSGWNPVSKFTKGAWLRTKLDVLEVLGKAIKRVRDWKTGGIDKETGEVKAQAKYDDQLLTYSIVTLCSDSAVQEVSSELVFTDCGPRFSPIIELGTLKRSGLDKAKKTMEKKILPMFNDSTFAPRPSYRCRYCDFGKGKGGPCRY
jgi:hypothetical protein